MDLLTRDELGSRKARILRLWDVFEIVGMVSEAGVWCCDGCTENNVWVTYGDEAADLWRELQEIRALLGERETPKWTC